MDKEQRKLEQLRLSNDAALMREYIRSAMGDCLQQHLHARITDATERLLTGGVEGFLELKGYIRGLREALGLPQHLVDIHAAQKR